MDITVLEKELKDKYRDFIGCDADDRSFVVITSKEQILNKCAKNLIFWQIEINRSKEDPIRYMTCLLRLEHVKADIYQRYSTIINLEDIAKYQEKYMLKQKIFDESVKIAKGKITNACIPLAVYLHEKFKEYKIDSEIVKGFQRIDDLEVCFWHCWVVSDNTIYDLTRNILDKRTNVLNICGRSYSKDVGNFTRCDLDNEAEITTYKKNNILIDIYLNSKNSNMFWNAVYKHIDNDLSNTDTDKKLLKDTYKELRRLSI